MNQSSEKYPLFKFIIIGESGTLVINVGVGKSCLLLRYTKDEFNGEYNVTIGVEFSSKTVEVDNNTRIKLQIWDTAGQESFRSIVRSFYRNVSAVFLVYSIQRKESLDKLQGWLQEARENSNDKVVTVLVGAQNDLEGERQVSFEEGKQWMEEKGLNLFFETSAKNNQNVELAFQETAKLVFLKYVTDALKRNESKVSISLSENHEAGQQLRSKQDTPRKEESGCC